MKSDVSDWFPEMGHQPTLLIDCLLEFRPPCHSRESQRALPHHINVHGIKDGQVISKTQMILCFQGWAAACLAAAIFVGATRPVPLSASCFFIT